MIRYTISFLIITVLLTGGVSLSRPAAAQTQTLEALNAQLLQVLLQTVAKLQAELNALLAAQGTPIQGALLQTTSAPRTPAPGQQYLPVLYTHQENLPPDAPRVTFVRKLNDSSKLKSSVHGGAFLATHIFKFNIQTKDEDVYLLPTIGLNDRNTTLSFHIEEPKRGVTITEITTDDILAAEITSFTDRVGDYYVVRENDEKQFRIEIQVLLEADDTFAGSYHLAFDTLKLHTSSFVDNVWIVNDDFYTYDLLPESHFETESVTRTLNLD